ncbi:MAG: RnfABCDGE type electron transport complex subunit D [Bacteroidales bacterium]|nr:RnfABCDGE type electron transport complex subunit D [Bacteroidales bacterium]
MQLIRKQYNPFIRKNDSTTLVMSDVMIALLPSILITWLAFGFAPLVVILVSVGTALLAEYLFDLIFRKSTSSLGDGSAIVTGILLALTIGPFTPLPIVAVGAFFAVVFGKMLWGGLGRNTFNPALIGREFMVVLFPAVMNSSAIFNNPEYVRGGELNVFNNEFWDSLVFHPIGAMGEYSPLLLVIGGLYLLLRRRISWHIPLALWISFSLMLFFFRDHNILFNIGGVLLGTIYMATDMPTSSSTHAGKIYFGAMVGVVALLCLLFGATRGYLSYVILLLNAFVIPINWIFRPRTWGKDVNWGKRAVQAVLLTIGIIAATFAILWLHHAEGMLYVMLFYALYTIVRFVLSNENDPWGKLRKIKRNLQ